MKRPFRFLLMTALATVAIAGLFVVLVCAPEPWQARSWTLWERCAQLLVTVLGWPLWISGLVFARLPWRMPDSFAVPIYCLLFLASGAFWAGVIEIAWNRIKRIPNRGDLPNGGSTGQG